MTASRKAMTTFGALVSICAASPGLLYVAALGTVEGRPELVEPAEFSREAIESAWVACGESLPMRLRRLDPWTASAVILSGESRNAPSGIYAASRIASSHNLRHLVGRRWWHASNAALAIWISRNWTVEQLGASLAAYGGCKPRLRKSAIRARTG